MVLFCSSTHTLCATCPIHKHSCKHFLLHLGAFLSYIHTHSHSWMHQEQLGLRILPNDTLACRLEQPGIEPRTSSTSWATATPKMWLQRRYNEAAEEGKLGKAMEGRNERMMVLQEDRKDWDTSRLKFTTQWLKQLIVHSRKTPNR